MKQHLSTEMRANGQKLFAELARSILTIRARRRVSEWAEAERWIGQGASPLSVDGAIRYRCEVMPWCREPMDSVLDRDVQATVLWFASGMAKTEIAANVIGYCVHERPCNGFVVYPKDDSRDKFSRDVIERMIDSTPALNRLFVESKSRDAGRTISYKKFAGGSLYLVGAGSASNFRGPRAGLVYLDEIDGMPDDVDGEGDPVTLAFKRAEGFADAIKILSGTGTFAPRESADGKTQYRSRIHFWHEQGDQRKWFVPCLSCRHRQALTWENMRVPKGQPELARIVCLKCGHEHDDAGRIAMVRAGEWRATVPFNGVRSYWLHGLNALLPAEKGYRDKLHQFAVDAERAMKSPQSRRVWINTFCAGLDTPEAEGEAAPDWRAVFNRREEYNDGRGKIVVPRGALVLTAGIDVQKNRLEILWQGNGRNEETWCIAHTVLGGEVTDDAVWRDLERELQRSFAHECGRRIELSLALVDAGKWPESILRFLAGLLKTGSPLRGRVRACRGASTYPHPLVDPRWRTLAKQLKGHWIGTDFAKDRIYSQLRLERGDEINPPPGWRHYAYAQDENFFTQLTAEEVRVEYRGGEEMRRYKNPDRRRNEALDVSVYADAAFALHRAALDFDAIERELSTIEQAPPAPAPAAQPRQPRSSFVGAGNWKI